MRTAIFVGFLSLAAVMKPQTGFSASDDVVNFITAVVMATIIMDVFEFLIHVKNNW